MDRAASHAGPLTGSDAISESLAIPPPELETESSGLPGAAEAVEVDAVAVGLLGAVAVDAEAVEPPGAVEVDAEAVEPPGAVEVDAEAVEPSPPLLRSASLPREARSLPAVCGAATPAVVAAPDDLCGPDAEGPPVAEGVAAPVVVVVTGVEGAAVSEGTNGGWSGSFWSPVVVRTRSQSAGRVHRCALSTVPSATTRRTAAPAATGE